MAVVTSANLDAFNRAELAKRGAGKKPTVELFHGSSEQNLPEVKSGGVFGGLFASSNPVAAKSHGSHLHKANVQEDKIMRVGQDVPARKLRAFTNSEFPKTDYKDELEDHLTSAKSLFDSSIPEDELLRVTRSYDLGEADWEMQRKRGLLAKSLGYHAAEMPDEHGMSYLLLPGNKLSPA